MKEYTTEKNRLKYADDGADVPLGLKVSKEGRKRYVTTAAGQKEVLTAAAYYNRRLKFADDGGFVPLGLEVFTEGGKQYVTTAEGKKEVVTAGAYSNRRFKFADDGSVVPSVLEVHKEGDKQYVTTAEGQKEVVTAGVYSSRRLKFADDGGLVPSDLEVHKQGDKRYVTTVTGQKEVVTAGAYCQRRFKFADDGSDVPLDLGVCKEGRKQYVTTAAGKRQVMTASGYSYRRLIFADNGHAVPLGLEVYTEGDKQYVTTAAGQKEVVTAAAYYQRRLKLVNDGDDKDIEEPQVVMQSASADEAPLDEGTPRAGVSDKYFKARVSRLPRQAGVLEEARCHVHESSLELVSLRDGEVFPAASMTSIPIRLSGNRDSPATINMTLHTNNPDISSNDKPVFVFAGRKAAAFIPNLAHDSESNTRIILVGTRRDVDELKRYIKPGLDFLEIDELASASHGRYTNLGLLNSRRIAAFCCAMYFHQRHQIQHAMMSDDNIKSVHFNSGRGVAVSWGEFFSDIALQLEQQQSVCVSLPSISENGARKNKVGELGSKLFMFDVRRLHETLGDDVARWFLPFLPEQGNAYWGEDYYFQLMFQAMFATTRHGYRVLDATNFGIKRASLPSLCRTVVKTADALCETNLDGLFAEGLDAIARFERSDLAHRKSIEAVIEQLQVMIQDNVRRHQKQLQRGTTKSLMAAHAWANHLEYALVDNAPGIADDGFLRALQATLRKVQTMGHLHPYQTSILTNVCKHLGGNRFIGQLNMATGTGKTYVQIYLAIAALLTGTTRPIVIVTPYKQLVQQAYRDFIHVLRDFPELPIQAAQVLKVDSELSSVSAETLQRNRTLDDKACVLIFCQDSYATILDSTEPNMERYQHPCMLLVDESHLQTTTLERYRAMNQDTRHGFIAGLSATPKKQGQAIWNRKGSVLIQYPRERAVADGYIAPCVLDHFDGVYSSEHVLDVIHQLPELLRRALMPSGGVLGDRKGIVYVPNTSGDINYSRILKRVLDKAGIASFEINSQEPDSKDNLEAYRSYHADACPRKILICKGMAKIGFSDSETSWVIYLQHGNEAEFCQSAGRAMRALNDKKVAYVLAFADVQSGLIFRESSITRDAKSLERCSPVYQAQRDKTEGSIAIRWGACRMQVNDSSARTKRPHEVAEACNVDALDSPSSSPLLSAGFFQASSALEKRRKLMAVTGNEKQSCEAAIKALEAEVANHKAILADDGRSYFPHSALGSLIAQIHLITDPHNKVPLLQKLMKSVINPLLPIHPKMHGMASTIQCFIEDSQSVAMAY